MDLVRWSMHKVKKFSLLFLGFEPTAELGLFLLQKFFQASLTPFVPNAFQGRQVLETATKEISADCVASVSLGRSKKISTGRATTEWAGGGISFDAKPTERPSVEEQITSLPSFAIHFSVSPRPPPHRHH